MICLFLCGISRCVGRGQFVQQGEQLLFFFVRQGGEEGGKPLFALVFEFVGARFAFFGQIDAGRAAVVRIRAAFDIAGLLQFVDELGCRGRTDMHLFCDRFLAQAVFVFEQDAQDALSGEHPHGSHAGAVSHGFGAVLAVRAVTGTVAVGTMFAVRAVAGTVAVGTMLAVRAVAAMAVRTSAFRTFVLLVQHHSHLTWCLHQAFKKSFINRLIHIHLPFFQFSFIDSSHTFVLSESSLQDRPADGISDHSMSCNCCAFCTSVIFSSVP